MLAFGAGKLKNVKFLSCDLAGASFTDNQVKSLRVTKCNLTHCEFFRTPLAKVDLSDSEIGGIRISGSELRGAEVSPAQAVLLAGLLGVIVKV